MAQVQPTMIPMATPLPKGRIRKQAAPYFHELGLVVASWNELHEQLGQLFWTVTGISNGYIALGIWHSTENDRAQRKMLEAILPFSLGELQRAKQNGPNWVHRAREEIKWILDRVNTLADRRNDAVHSPFLIQQDGQRWKVASSTFFQHPRAKKLGGKELLSEFRWYRKTADALSSYAQNVRLGLYAESFSWPNRPSLPPLKPIRRRLSKKTASKGRRP